jgi:chemotaxis methyl-accepting protein methylase
VVLPAVRSRKGIDPPRELVLWSAGCSTGQEAYSLAAACLDADGTRGWDVRVLGTDACRANLDRAERGVYRGYEAASLPAEVRDRYFRPLPRGDWQVGPELAAAVRFAELDLTAPGRYPVPAADAAVCQNVLIYYAAAAKTGIIARLAAAVAPGGYLFLGPADAVGLPTPGLTAVRLGDTWAYHRTTP